MYFDRTNATLLATPQDLTALARHLAADGAGGAAEAGRVPPVPTEWESNGVSHNGQLDPTVVGIVEVMNRPFRSVAIERFDGQLVDVMFVAWDRLARATMASGVGEDHLAITATQFDLLPALLTQAVRLHSKSPAGARGAITTTAGTVERAIEGHNSSGAELTGGEPASQNGQQDQVGEDVLAVLGSLRHAWRASGSWHGKETDAAMTVLNAGSEGLWVVEHGAAEPGAQPSTDTPVRLRPASAAEITGWLGDVVTGRKSAPTPQVAA